MICEQYGGTADPSPLCLSSRHVSFVATISLIPISFFNPSPSHSVSLTFPLPLSLSLSSSAGHTATGSLPAGIKRRLPRKRPPGAHFRLPHRCLLLCCVVAPSCMIARALLHFCLLSSVVVCCRLLSSVVVCRRLLSSVVVCCCLLLSVAVCCYVAMFLCCYVVCVHVACVVCCYVVLLRLVHAMAVV